MRIKGISWVGVKTDEFVALGTFRKSVLGLPVLLDRPDFLVFRMPDGDQLELFGPSARHPPAQFASNRVVCGFLVDDLDSARRELEQAGIELLGGPERDSKTGYAWQHFRGPDGLVYELAYDPNRP